MQLTMPIVVALLVASLACFVGANIIDDAKRSLTGGGGRSNTGLDVKLGGDSARIGVRSDNGNLFYYEECSAGISGRGIDSGCQRVWKPLFYVCIAAGGLLAVLLLSCCCCCCCAPCKKGRRPVAYHPTMSQSSSVILVQSEAPTPMSNPPPPKYGDVQMLHA